MSELLGIHIVGFPTRRLKSSAGKSASQDQAYHWLMDLASCLRKNEFGFHSIVLCKRKTHKSAITSANRPCHGESLPFPIHIWVES